MASDLQSTATAGYDLSQKSHIYGINSSYKLQHQQSIFFPSSVFAMAAYISTSATEDLPNCDP